MNIHVQNMLSVYHFEIFTALMLQYACSDETIVIYLQDVMVIRFTIITDMHALNTKPWGVE